LAPSANLLCTAGYYSGGWSGPP